MRIETNKQVLITVTLTDMEAAMLVQFVRHSTTAAGSDAIMRMVEFIDLLEEAIR